MSITNEAVQTVDLAILASFGEAQEQGEPDFVVELIDLYLEEAPRFFNSIRDGLANNDWLSAKRAAHSLRGSSSNLGIVQMSLIAGALEQLTTNQDASAAELLQGLEDEFTRVEEILLAERQRRTS
ncbi:MAG TPA: Hpt domain-containing protein [Pyrinomonadaceae bacterium]|jgi:HPt (histidine-containing phosphotransfer) domain-containing protein|nr:Hpt domain-containing protein [Pyrinomonadaceae bacterium]